MYNNISKLDYAGAVAAYESYQSGDYNALYNALSLCFADCAFVSKARSVIDDAPICGKTIHQYNLLSIEVRDMLKRECDWLKSTALSALLNLSDRIKITPYQRACLDLINKKELNLTAIRQALLSIATEVHEMPVIPVKKSGMGNSIDFKSYSNLKINIASAIEASNNALFLERLHNLHRSCGYVIYWPSLGRYNDYLPEEEMQKCYSIAEYAQKVQEICTNLK